MHVPVATALQDGFDADARAVRVFGFESAAEGGVGLGSWTGLDRRGGFGVGGSCVWRVRIKVCARGNMAMRLSFVGREGFGAGFRLSVWLGWLLLGEG